MKAIDKFLALVGISALLLAAPATTMAVANIGTWSFLRGTPAEFFTDKDWAILESTLMDVLNNGEDGSTTAWNNSRTKASGDIQILRTVNNTAHYCRLVRFTSQAKSRSNQMELIYCKQPDGEWKIAMPKVGS